MDRDHPQTHCVGCRDPLGDIWVENSLGGAWHPPCFLCTGCRKPITESQFQVHGRDPYHKPCYQKKFDPFCEVCLEYIPINERSGMIEWRFHPYWGTKYCPAHELDQTPRCGSCERMQPRDKGYIDLDDVRKLCPQCYDSVTMDPKDTESLCCSVRDFYAALGLTIEEKIPVSLVDTKALQAAAEKDGHHLFEPGARGMCMSEQHIIQTLHRESPISTRGKGQAHLGALRHDVPRELTRKCVVTGILVLFGFPRLLTGSIVAHEMMHAWLKLEGPFPYSNSTQKSILEEGICQYMAYMWLQTQVDSLASSTSAKGQFERRLGECLMQQIENHDSPVYGDGFRAARFAIAEFGLPLTLHRIKTTGHF